jgi:transcriptional regulator with XRE-family HTH domain
MSMNALAQKAGLHYTAISLIERELRSPSLDTLIRISDVLKMDLGETIQEAFRAAKRTTA